MEEWGKGESRNAIEKNYGIPIKIISLVMKRGVRGNRGGIKDDSGGERQCRDITLILKQLNSEFSSRFIFYF